MKQNKMHGWAELTPLPGVSGVLVRCFQCQVIYHVLMHTEPLQQSQAHPLLLSLHIGLVYRCRELE